MSTDKFKLSLIISAAAVALTDIAYVIFLGIQVYRVQSGVAALSESFKGFSTAIIGINAGLLCFTLIYLILRKR